MSGPASSPLRRSVPMLAGALSAVIAVAVIAVAGGHLAFGGSGGDEGESPCGGGACQSSRCVRARDVSRERRDHRATTPCPPLRARTGGEEEHARPRPSWRL